MTPIFYSFFLKGYIKVYGIKTKLDIVKARFLKVHSITFNFELSSKYVGVGVNFALLKGDKSCYPHFLFCFLKAYIHVYEIKTKL